MRHYTSAPDADWVRREFPVVNEVVYLNHAAVAPISARCRDAVREWADSMAREGDRQLAHWWDRFEQGRRDAAALIGAHRDEIAFVGSTSDGLAIVAEGFPWQTGDEILVPQAEFPSNVYPWLHLADRGVTLRRIPWRGERIELEDIEATLGDRTRMIAVSWVQFLNGFRIDLAGLAEICQRRQIALMVDAIQGVGALPLNVHALGIDFLAVDGHKWLCAPEGAGFLYVRRDRIDSIRPTKVGWNSVAGANDFTRIDLTFRDSARRFESGTPNTPGLVGLAASLAHAREVGIDRIAEHLQSITDRLINGLVELGAEIASPRGPGEWSGIVAFTHARLDVRPWVRTARRDGFLLSERAGRIRVSPHFYTPVEQIDRFISYIRANLS